MAYILHLQIARVISSSWPQWVEGTLLTSSWFPVGRCSPGRPGLRVSVWDASVCFSITDRCSPALSEKPWSPSLPSSGCWVGRSWWVTTSAGLTVTYWPELWMSSAWGQTSRKRFLGSWTPFLWPASFSKTVASRASSRRTWLRPSWEFHTRPIML